jgi:hypothetical protein
MSELDEIMGEVNRLVFTGDLSRSQVMMVDSDEEPVVEQLRQKYGQEQLWTWNDPRRSVGWGDEKVRVYFSRDDEEEAEEEKVFGHWWKGEMKSVTRLPSR